MKQGSCGMERGIQGQITRTAYVTMQHIHLLISNVSNSNELSVCCQIKYQMIFVTFHIYAAVYFRNRNQNNFLVLHAFVTSPYDEYTMPLRCPNHCFCAASAGTPCDHRTDLQASWPLRFCLTPHDDKFEKIVSP